MKYGNLNFLEPSGPLQACNGTALPLYVRVCYVEHLKILLEFNTINDVMLTELEMILSCITVARGQYILLLLVLHGKGYGTEFTKLNSALHFHQNTSNTVTAHCINAFCNVRCLLQLCIVHINMG